MPRSRRYHDDFRLRSDFIAADVNAGLALLALAEREFSQGATLTGGCALDEAERVYRDAHRLLLKGALGDAPRWRPELEKLKSTIDFYSIVLRGSLTSRD